jgi:hypothetical protein
MASTTAPGHWWARATGKGSDPALPIRSASPPRHTPALRAQRSFASLSSAAAAAAASSSGAHSGASSPKRSAGKLFTSALGLRRGRGDVALVIQDPPPVPPLPLPMRTRAPSNAGRGRAGGGFTGRPPATSVSSSACDSLPEPATPSDGPDRRSFSHSVITLADDPFAARGGPLAPEPGRLSAYSALSGKRPRERELREQRAPQRESVASATSAGSSRETHLSSPWPASPRTYRSSGTTDVSSPMYAPQTTRVVPC